jgi:hypothetical protein
MTESKMSAELYSPKVQVIFNCLFSVLSIGLIVSTYFLSWMEVDIYASAFTIKNSYYITGVSQYINDQLKETVTYADADSQVDNLNCDLASTTALVCGIVVAVVHLLNCAVNLYAYFKQKNLFSNRFCILIYGYFVLAIIAESAGVAYFKGPQCLAKIADNFRSSGSIGKVFDFPFDSFYPIIFLSSFSIMLTVNYLLTWIKVRRQLQQQENEQRNPDHQPLLR